MDLSIGCHEQALVRLVMPLGVALLAAHTATAQTIQGTAYRERMALPPNAVFEASQVAPPAGAPPLEKTHWRATELGGQPVTAASAAREPHLVIEEKGRVAGSDGCNRMTGTYERTSEAITFGRMAATQMACPDSSDTERRFRDALTATRRWSIVGNSLELFDATGTRLARFEARRQP